MNQGLENTQDHGEEDGDTMATAEPAREAVPVTDDDLRAEEQAITELEQKKRELEERVASMERDLGGLLQ
jgi:hypothetical protein